LSKDQYEWSNEKTRGFSGVRVVPLPSGGVRMVWLPSILTTTEVLRAISRALSGRTRTTVTTSQYKSTFRSERAVRGSSGGLTNFNVVGHFVDLRTPFWRLGEAYL